MLTSQAIPVSQTTMALQSSLAPSTTMLRSASGLSRRPRPHKQIRTFRIGLWSSYLDLTFQKEVQRRHRIIKHKYIEALNRKLSWDRQLPVHARHLGFKSFMCSAWRGQDRRPGGRWVNVEELEALHNSQENNGGGIEDVEQGPVDRLLKNHQDRMNDLIRTRSRMFGSNWGITDSTKESSAEPKSASVSGPSNETAGQSSVYGNDTFKRRFQNSKSTLEAEYEIDPITNRKVFKNKSNSSPESTRKSIDIPVKTFRGYRSQFQTFSLPQASDPARKSLKEHEKEEYKSVYYNEPDGNLPTEPDPGQESLKDSDSRTTYEAVRYNESDREAPENPCQVQESLKEYDAKVSYGPVWHQEPDIKSPEKPCPVQEGLKDYDLKISYGPVYYKEPDGRDLEKPCPVQEGLKDYDSRVTYGPVYCKELDGKNPEKSCPVQEGLKEYDDKVTYEPVYHNETDGKDTEKPCSVQNGLKEYDAKVDYGTSRRSHLERRAKRGPGSSSAVTKTLFGYQGEDTTEDLDLPRTSDVRAASGISKGARKETEAEKNTRRRQLEEDFYRSQALDKTCPEEEAALEKVKETRKLVEDLRIEHSELLNHAGHARGKVNAKIAEVEAGWPELSKSKKMTGNFVRDFPEEFETTWTAEKSGTGTLTPRKNSTLGNEQEVENKEVVGANESTEAFNGRPGIDRIEPALDRRASTNMSNLSEMERLEIESDSYSKESMGLETSYADECALRQNLAQEGNSGRVKFEFGAKDEERLEKIKAKFESEYEGGLKATNFDPYPEVLPSASNNTQKFDKQKHKELVREVRSIYEDAYGTIDTNHRQVPQVSEREAAPTADAEIPTLYKILAYDPTMQSISEAETTSIVTDSASPLTPAEVLLRLSNPAKFFPHFAPLQSQGYEIVSGSGDVLVFRKVRSGAPPRPANEPSFASQDYKRRAMNPIDGMQPIAATGNFASPTGFVNHDLPEESDPPFKSNIDVRREEAVFSGKSNWQTGEETSKKKAGRGKRFLIGAVWVGACSYAVGVVAEFFKTGGMDGLGPKGF